MNLRELTHEVGSVMDRNHGTPFRSQSSSFEPCPRVCDQSHNPVCQVLGVARLGNVLLPSFRTWTANADPETTYSATCQKRNFRCTYHTSDHDSHYHSFLGDQSSPKRARRKPDANQNALHSRGNHQSDLDLNIKISPSNHLSEKNTVDNISTFFQAQPQNTKVPEIRSYPSPDGDEEADNHTMVRMLEDGTGRLLYVGDASTLSFLQLLRMIVETAVGPCSFSLYPGRHGIVENQLDVSLERKLTYRLPDKETALILVESFFINVGPSTVDFCLLQDMTDICPVIRYARDI